MNELKKTANSRPETDPDDGPDENSYAGLDDGSLAHNIKEIEDDASLVQVSTCCFI